LSKKTQAPAGTPSKNFLGLANDYVADVLNGTVPACKWVQLACQRQRDELKRWGGGKDDPYVFVPDAAARVCRFVELLPHIEGPKAERGERLIIEPWQAFVLSTAFGWKVATTMRRRFRRSYLELPRGNGKSTLLSAVALYMGFADGESGAKTYSAATKKDQARVVFDVSQHMARRTPEFRAKFGVEVSAHSIHQISTASKFVPLSAEDDSLDGLNIHCAVIDELHAHKTRKLYEVLETGVNKRDQSMLWTITTAGWNIAGICYEIRRYLLAVLEGNSEDHGFFGIIWTIDDEDDWTTIEALRKANPNWGISVDESGTLGLQKKAIQVPSAVNGFLTKCLNVWVSSDTGLFDMRAWAAAGDPKLRIEQFVGRKCWIGVDLGFVDDIAAVVQLFEIDDGYVAFGTYYLPEATVTNNRNSQYSGWQRAGYITQTHGSVTHIGRIVSDIGTLLAEHNVQEITYDRYGKLILLNQFHEQGIPIEKLEEFDQSVRSMSPATERTMQLVLEGKIRHDGNPVLFWAMGNVIGHFDKNNNVHATKESNDLKIDPSIALQMCVGRAMVATNVQSVYADPETAVI